MISNSEIHKVDGFRFLNQLHTTARQIEVCSQIVLELGSSQRIKSSLHNVLISWSLKREKDDPEYSRSKGKLTYNGKSTTAFNHYLDLCRSLGLIADVNGIITNTRLSHILIFFLTENKSVDKFKKVEKYFYFYLLLMKDADGIFLILDILTKGANNQQSLQRLFQQSLNNRLLIKSGSSSSYVKSIINEKYRAINYIWKKPEKYAEHLLIPRCEWLNQLEIIEIKNVKGSTLYSLTDRGRLMLKLLPRLSNTDFIDIDENWMLNEIFTLIAGVYYDDFTFKTRHYSGLDVSYLGVSIETATNVVKSSSLFRIPSFDSLLFISLNMLIENNLVVNFSDIISVLYQGLTYDGRTYLIKNLGRINESYITTRLTQ